MTAPQPILDHIVILVPHDTLTNLPTWLSTAFTILDGGRHADGVTENKLILFQDGVYFELIAFIPGKEGERQAHRWGQRREGHIIDWANTLHSVDDLQVVRDRVASAGSGIKYGEPIAGGRVKPDGTELKWTTSAPYIDGTGGTSAGFVGGEAPFWCLDRTPRNLRVPHGVEGNVKHPVGAVGVASVTVSVRDKELLQTLKTTYDALQGHEGTKLSGDSGSASTYAWNLVVPEETGLANARRKLILTHTETTHKASPGVAVTIDLIGSSEGSVSGHLGDEDWTVEFKLRA